MRRKLFLSFGGILKALADKRINSGDLFNGLFFLDCSRSAFKQALEQLPPVGDGRIAILIDNVTFKADFYGRSRWVLIGEKSAYYLLNFLLVDNGYKVLNPPDYYLFTAEEITRLMQETNPEVEVIA